MATFLFWLALLNVLLCVYVLWQLIAGGSQIPLLNHTEPLTSDLPRVSIVVAARNEERNIEPALRSLLKLDYPNLQLIVVDDRSTDGTPQILDRLSAEDSKLTIVHIRELPKGWLGKNHALYCGAEQADGEWLLFTDADIVMAPSTLRRAVGYAVEHQLDHLPMLFRVDMPNWFLESFVVVFSVFFFAYFRPWKVRDPKSAAHIGIGGFNMLRRSVYQSVGTFKAIAMRPDDDMKLGKIVKKHGFRQELVVAADFISVPWYASLREVIVGLEKNAFAGVEYRPWVTIVSSIGAVTFNVFPFVAVFLTNGATQWLYVLTVLLIWMIALGAAKSGKLRSWPALFFPLTVLLFVYIQWRTMIVNLWNDGINWRDTHYSLAELKANKV